MSGVVAFDSAAFLVRYPEFASINTDLLSAFFDEATLIVNNTQSSKVKGLTERKVLLWLLTAHLTEINQGTDGSGPSGMVGRVSSASEGSVSVGSSWASSSASQWYDQTGYGAEFWALTAKYRRMHYVPGQSNPASRYTRGYFRRGF